VAACAKALIPAAKRGDLDQIQQLLRVEGVDVNFANEKDQTALHAAAENGHVEVVADLLAKGVDVNARNQQGQTPLHLAALEGHAAVVAALLAKGAAVNAMDVRDQTALQHVLVELDPQKHAAVIGALLDAETDPQIGGDDQNVLSLAKAKKENSNTAVDRAFWEGLCRILEAAAGVQARAQAVVTPPPISDSEVRSLDEDEGDAKDEPVSPPPAVMPADKPKYAADMDDLLSKWKESTALEGALGKMKKKSDSQEEDDNKAQASPENKLDLELPFELPPKKSYLGYYVQRYLPYYVAGTALATGACIVATALSHPLSKAIKSVAEPIYNFIGLPFLKAIPTPVYAGIFGLAGLLVSTAVVLGVIYGFKWCLRPSQPAAQLPQVDPGVGAAPLLGEHQFNGPAQQPVIVPLSAVQPPQPASVKATAASPPK
jgi:hypothetical protein